MKQGKGLYKQFTGAGVEEIDRKDHQKHSAHSDEDAELIRWINK